MKKGFFSAPLNGEQLSTENMEIIMGGDYYDPTDDWTDEGGSNRGKVTIGWHPKPEADEGDRHPTRR